MTSVTFYLSPDTTTLSALKDLYDDLLAGGVPFESMTAIGLTGHMGVVDVDNTQAMTVLDVLSLHEIKITNVSTDMGSFTEAFGRSAVLTDSKARAFILMGGRISR